jgi:hypothetical protein
LGTIGVDGRAKRTNCTSSIGANVSSILDWAQQLGKYLHESFFGSIHGQYLIFI